MREEIHVKRWIRLEISSISYNKTYVFAASSISHHSHFTLIIHISSRVSHATQFSKIHVKFVYSRLNIPGARWRLNSSAIVRDIAFHPRDALSSSSLASDRKGAPIALLSLRGSFVLVTRINRHFTSLLDNLGN